MRMFEQRFAAHLYGENPFRHNKMKADLFLLPEVENWMTPLRDNLKRYVILY
jgi:hypothetical protein